MPAQQRESERERKEERERAKEEYKITLEIAARVSDKASFKNVSRGYQLAVREHKGRLANPDPYPDGLSGSALAPPVL